MSQKYWECDPCDGTGTVEGVPGQIFAKCEACKGYGVVLNEGRKPLETKEQIEEVRQLTQGSNYQERLSKVEHAFSLLEIEYTQLKTELAAVLRDRPCDFYLEYKGRRWVQYRDTRGHRASFGWGTISPDHKAVWTAKRRSEAEKYAKYLSEYHKIQGIEVKERKLH